MCTRIAIHINAGLRVRITHTVTFSDCACVASVFRRERAPRGSSPVGQFPSRRTRSLSLTLPSISHTLRLSTPSVRSTVSPSFRLSHRLSAYNATHATGAAATDGISLSLVSAPVNNVAYPAPWSQQQQWFVTCARNAKTNFKNSFS